MQLKLKLYIEELISIEDIYSTQSNWNLYAISVSPFQGPIALLINSDNIPYSFQMYFPWASI